MIHLSQVVLKRLAALAIDLRFKGEGPIEELMDIPEDILQYVLWSGELDETDMASHARIVRLLARDPRPSVRLAALYHFPLYDRPLSEEAQEVFEELANDPDPGVRLTFLDHIAEMFDRSSILERTRLVGLWATSENPYLRIAVARALQSPFIALGVSTAIRALCHDPDDGVRREAQIAGLHRRVEPEAA